METYNGTVILQFDDSTKGNADSGALVTVREHNIITGSGALATIYDLNEVATLNPITTDSLGNYSFKAADGLYDIIIREGQASEVKLAGVRISSITPSVESVLLTPVAGQTVYALPAEYADAAKSFLWVDGRKMRSDGAAPDYTIDASNNLVLSEPVQENQVLEITFTTNMPTVATQLPVGNVGNPREYDSLRGLLNTDLSGSGIQIGEYIKCLGRVDKNDGGARTYVAVGAGGSIDYEKLIPLYTGLNAELVDGTVTRLSNSEIEIAAHRGFTHFNVEGSMYAFSSALNYGANSLECDVQVTSDGYLVLFHDKGNTSALLNNITGAISDNTYAQVQAATYKELAGNILENKVQLATFGELLDFVQLTGCRLHAEIKDYRTQADIDLMLAEVTSRDLEDSVVFHSFIFSDIAYVRAANKRVKVSFLSTNLTGLDPEGYDIADAFDWIKRDKWAMVALSINAIDFDANGYDAVKAFQEAGVEVAAWTAENGIDFLFARRNNVNIIMTDLPYAYNQPLRINNGTSF